MINQNNNPQYQSLESRRQSPFTNYKFNNENKVFTPQALTNQVYSNPNGIINNNYNYYHKNTPNIVHGYHNTNPIVHQARENMHTPNQRPFGNVTFKNVDNRTNSAYLGKDNSKFNYKN